MEGFKAVAGLTLATRRNRPHDGGRAYHYVVSGRTFAPGDLTDLLERFRPERAGQKASPEIAEVQIQLLLTRVAALTDALRGAESNEATRLASRIVLNDLAAVAGQFRARANTMRPALAKALADSA